MLRTLQRGDGVIFGRKVVDATMKKVTTEGPSGQKKVFRENLRLAHWCSVIKAGMAKERIGEFQEGGSDHLGPRLILHVPPASDETAVREYHNRLMRLCGISFAGLADKMLLASSKGAVKKEQKSKKQPLPTEAVEDAVEEEAAPSVVPGRKRLRQAAAPDAVFQRFC